MKRQRELTKDESLINQIIFGLPDEVPAGADESTDEKLALVSEIERLQRKIDTLRRENSQHREELMWLDAKLVWLNTEKRIMDREKTLLENCLRRLRKTMHL